MIFKAHGRAEGNPHVAAKIKMDPVRFETGVSGSCDLNVGAISAHIGDVRIRFAIPFMKPRRKLPLVATVGGFPVRLKPLKIRCGLEGIGIAGVMGIGGMGAEVDARMACQMEGDVDGILPFKNGRIHVELDENEVE